MDVLISKQMTIDAFKYYPIWCTEIIKTLPSVRLKYTKADYIMALHKEYGCTLIKAEEAHNKALEFLRNEAKLKG